MAASIPAIARSRKTALKPVSTSPDSRRHEQRVLDKPVQEPDGKPETERKTCPGIPVSYLAQQPAHGAQPGEISSNQYSIYQSSRRSAHRPCSGQPGRLCNPKPNRSFHRLGSFPPDCRDRIKERFVKERFVKETGFESKDSIIEIWRGNDRIGRSWGSCRDMSFETVNPRRFSI